MSAYKHRFSCRENGKTDSIKNISPNGVVVLQFSTSYFYWAGTEFLLGLMPYYKEIVDVFHFQLVFS